MSTSRDQALGLIEELEARPPKDDAARSEFAKRVEDLLDTQEMPAPAMQAALHILAAEVLSGSSPASGDIVQARLLRHLDRAEALAAEAPDLAKSIVPLRATAFVAFETSTSAESIASAIRAFDNLLRLSDPETDPATLGSLAYNAARYLERHVGPPGNDEERVRLESLLRQALLHYRAAGLDRRAMDAAARLAQLAFQRLAAASNDEPERHRLFEEAWRLINEAMAGSVMTERPEVWAQRNRIAAALILQRPGGLQADNSSDAILYLNRAFDIYRNIGDREAAASCASDIADVMEAVAAPWTTKLVERLEFYLDAAASTRPGDSTFDAERMLSVANAWAKVPAPDAPERTEKIRHAAERAYRAGLNAGLEDVCAAAQIHIGDSWLQDAHGADHDENGQPPISALECERLARACTAFERAIRHARAAGDSASEAHSTSRLGAALGRRVVECDAEELFDDCLRTLQKAIELSSGSERVGNCLNLASSLLAGVWRGLGVTTEGLRSAVDRVEQLRLEVDDDRISEAYRALKEALEEFELFGPHANHGPVSDALRAEALYFKVYRADSAEPPPPDLRRITLVLFAENDGSVDGSMRLAKTGTTVNANFETACPSCNTRREWTLPLIICFDTDATGVRSLERMVQGDETCANCGAVLQCQFMFVASSSGFAPLPVVVCPDAWNFSTSRAVQRQLPMLRALYHGWTGQPLDESFSMPWSDVVELKTSDADSIMTAQRNTLLCLVALALARGDSGILRRYGEIDPHLWKTTEPVGSEELAAILNSFGDGRTPMPAGTDFAGLAAAINRFLELARSSDLTGALEMIDGMGQQSKAAKTAFESALAVAADRDARKGFLERFLSETSDYSPDRAQALYEFLQLGPELELKALEARGVAKDSNEYREVLAAQRASHELTQERIADDRKLNSSRTAKEIIKNSLAGDDAFILLLRAFSVEVDDRPVPSDMAATTKAISDARIGWRVTRIYMADNTMEAIATAMSAQRNLVMIANVRDVIPPKAVAKIFVTDVEWRKLAFCLIAEAAAIVFVLPVDQAISEGASDELAAISKLDRQDATIVVLCAREEDALDELFRKAEPVRGSDFPGKTAELNALGFERVFNLPEIAQTPALLADAVRHLSRTAAARRPASTPRPSP